jgi:hypothetical protein
MHACGQHTRHAAGRCRISAATRNFDGTLNLIFQPDEEGMTGALSMMEDGLFERFPCDAIYAFHNAPGAGRHGRGLARRADRRPRDRDLPRQGRAWRDSESCRRPHRWRWRTPWWPCKASSRATWRRWMRA